MATYKILMHTNAYQAQRSALFAGKTLIVSNSDYETLDAAKSQLHWLALDSGCNNFLFERPDQMILNLLSDHCIDSNLDVREYIKVKPKSILALASYNGWDGEGIYKAIDKGFIKIKDLDSTEFSDDGVYYCIVEEMAPTDEFLDYDEYRIGDRFYKKIQFSR